MHGPLRISSLSLEYLYVWVGGVAGDEGVEMALVQAAEPGEEDWVAASWANVTPQGADARILVGPGGDVEPADGTWQVWVRVTSAPEVPVLYSGPVQVT